MTQTFIFQHSHSNQWESITANVNNYLFLLKTYHKGDFEVEIREAKKKRSGNQLRAYWVIIRTVTKWMNDKGNSFTTDQISDYFKILSGHSSKINDEVIPKSIANKSDCTKEQMEGLINTILVFGAENLIDGCYIEDRDLEELLNYYK